jgi:[NiFe] hydrogenase diaphorase moiety small subunit
VKGKSLARPHGERKYDQQPDKELYSQPPSFHSWAPNGEKKLVATTSLAGCFGCHMSLLDIDEQLLDVIELVDFHKSPLTDIKRFEKRCDIGIIEGGCSNDENVEVLREFRKKCDILVSIGECAIWGGLPAMRNFVPLEECLTEAYVSTATRAGENAIIPEDDDLPKLLDRVYSCNEVVKIDYVVPGCPPDPHHMWKVVRHLLFGEAFTITEQEFKYD